MRSLKWLRVAIVVVLAFAASTADAIDLSIPIPKPSLPAIPTPSFLSRPGKKLSEEEVEAARRASDRDRDTVRLASREVPPQTRPNPAAARPRGAEAYEDIDLSPSYSELLPYTTVLGHVVCESNFPLDSVQGLQPEIAQLQLDLVNYLRIPETSEKIELCVFRDKASYQSFISQVFPGAPLDRPALYVRHADDPGVLMVQNDKNLIINIRHEMTHAYLNSTLKHVPIWLDEGLAKYFETPPGERGFRNPYLADVEASASGLFSSPPSLSRLEKLTRVDQMHTREYRESWSWVHFMIHYSPETHRILAQYLSTLRADAQRNITTAEAYKLQKKAPFKHILDESVPDVGRKYVEHFRNWDKRQAAYENGRAESEL